MNKAGEQRLRLNTWIKGIERSARTKNRSRGGKHLTILPAEVETFKVLKLKVRQEVT